MGFEGVTIFVNRTESEHKMLLSSTCEQKSIHKIKNSGALAFKTDFKTPTNIKNLKTDWLAIVTMTLHESGIGLVEICVGYI